MLIVKTIQYIRPTNSMKYGIIDITYLVWGGGAENAGLDNFRGVSKGPNPL